MTSDNLCESLGGAVKCAAKEEIRVMDAVKNWFIFGDLQIVFHVFQLSAFLFFFFFFFFDDGIFPLRVTIPRMKQNGGENYREKVEGETESKEED